jgi:uncharacterized protein
LVKSEGDVQGRDGPRTSPAGEQDIGPVAGCPPAGPAPEPSPDSEAWWEGLRAHRVILQRCRACGRIRFPPMPSCPWCASWEFELNESSGLGTVYSVVSVHAALSPAAATLVPYAIATVELDDGPRLVGRVEPMGSAAIGDRVRPRFTDHAGWTELCFQVVGADGSGDGSADVAVDGSDGLGS